MQQAVHRTLPLAPASDPATCQGPPLASAGALRAAFLCAGAPLAAPAAFGQTSRAAGPAAPAADAAFVNLGLVTRDTRADGGALLEWLDLDPNLGHGFNDLNTNLVLAAQGRQFASAIQRFQDLRLSIVGARGQIVAHSKPDAKVRAAPAP